MAACRTEDCNLSPDLVGYKVAESTLSPYERDVGFGFAVFPALDLKELGCVPPINLSLSEEDVASNRARWKDAVKELSMVSEEPLTSTPTGSSWSGHSSDSFDMPETPVSKPSYANIVVGNVTEHTSSVRSPPLSPSKPLNVFASAFTPKREASWSSAFTSSSPDLSSIRSTGRTSSQATETQQDESPKSFSPEAIPSISTNSSPRRRTGSSKTRTIVDQMRLKEVDGFPTHRSHNPSPVDSDQSFFSPRSSISDGGKSRGNESRPSHATGSPLGEDGDWVHVRSKSSKSNLRFPRLSAEDKDEWASCSELFSKSDASLDVASICSATPPLPDAPMPRNATPESKLSPSDPTAKHQVAQPSQVVAAASHPTPYPQTYPSYAMAAGRSLPRVGVSPLIVPPYFAMTNPPPFPSARPALFLAPGPAPYYQMVPVGYVRADVAMSYLYHPTAQAAPPYPYPYPPLSYPSPSQ